ncbi:MAG: AhpC/TSA family protein [Bacteroidetes bacterium]|nr:AhpC/TSA family protein [Bacteroidota bacterium]
MKLLFIVGFVVTYFTGNSQVNVTIRNAPVSNYYLQSFSINGYKKIDSVVIKDNKLVFQIPQPFQAGIYQVGDGKSNFDFILDEPSIEMETYGNALQDSLKIIKSPENLLYRQYQQRRDKIYMQMDLLNQVLQYYDHSTEFYQTTLHEFTSIQDGFFRWIDSISHLNDNSFLVHYIKTDIKPRISAGMSLSDQKKFFREHWFDGVDWMDNSMMNSDVLTRKITSYLGLYSNPNFKKPELEKAFEDAVDIILPLSAQNPSINDFTIKYLVRGFERYGFDDVILHIATNYSSAQQCENEQQSETQARLEKYKLLAPGKIAPDIQMQDLNGNEFSLIEVRSRKLLIFWASWCPHCQELIPQLVNWSGQAANKGIRIIPVSLDDNKKDLENAIAKLNIPWPVLVDFKKWNSKAVLDYNIYATPTMLLLDKDDKILAKPMNIKELQNAVNH